MLATYRVDDELPPRLRRLAAELARRPHRDADRARPARPRADVAASSRRSPAARSPRALADERARAGRRQPVLRRGAVRRAATRDRAAREAVLCARSPRLDGARTLARARRRRRARAVRAARARWRRDADALRAALDAGVLVRERDGVAFRHGLIGEVLYDRLLPGERAALHREIAGASSTIPRQRAHHCYRAGLRERGAGGLGGGRARGRAACSPTPRRACTSSARSSCGTGRRSTASSCSPAPPRRRASRGDPERAVRALPRGDRARRTIPPARRGSTSASASTTSGTTRPRWSATSRRWR